MNFKKAEKGSVAVLVAMSLSVLCGFTAFAVDFGLLASSKQSLQNAADAAALAAAADIGAGKNFATINETAKKYCLANGYDINDEDVDISIQQIGKKISVTITEKKKMGFSAILTGQNSRNVVSSATAEAESIFGSCPFAMFAGQRIEDHGSGIAITGNDILINGNIHSNSDISMQHAILTGGAIATAVRSTNPSTAGWSSNQIALDMPNIGSIANAMEEMYACVEFNSSVTKSAHDGFESLINDALEQYVRKMGLWTHAGLSLNGLFIKINGDLTFNGHSSFTYTANFPVTILAEGDINLNGAPLNSNIDSPVCIMSRTGDITVNGGGACFTGILFAPNGDITLNGNDAEFVGSLIAQNICKSGGRTKVSYNEMVDRFLPTSKVHLIN